MQLYIDNRSGAPIYDQIYSQIKDAILSGQVAEGEALPSIRALAKDLRISVITTKRAYDELENEGFIYTLPGKGCFVAERSTELLREENLRKIESHMQEIRRLAHLPGGHVLRQPYLVQHRADVLPLQRGQRPVVLAVNGDGAPVPAESVQDQPYGGGLACTVLAD